MKLSIDIHGLSEVLAIKTLEKFILNAPKDCEEILVVHGYSHGEHLKKMLQDPNKLRSKRIVRRKYTKNPGETVLVLDVQK